MSGLPSGICSISRGEQFLSLQEHNEGALVLILPPEGSPQDQNWDIRVSPNRNVVIRDPTSQKFLGLARAPHVNEQVIVEGDHPNEWQLRQSAQPGSYFIVVPGGPVDGLELALDNSIIRAFPPRAALRPLDQEDLSQAWRFQQRE